ncbi:MAG: hypothetical protein A2W33_10070 [Chloroflexi bacterium RBG_16_52_11]|nr:MAG: hypothetical protein A2W33_10070 [Chloroflexi bacterium RBG_16_52_11]
MTLKKSILTALVLILALGLIAASLQATYSLRKGETVSFASGRAGITFVKSQFSGTVTLTRKDSSKKLAEDQPAFTQKHLDVRLKDTQGNRIKHVVGSVYVYFVARDRDLRAWDAGELAIFFYDTWKGEWTECNTFVVSRGTNGQSLACRIRVFGLYGLGAK